MQTSIRTTAVMLVAAAGVALSATPSFADETNSAQGCTITTSTVYRTTSLRVGAWANASCDRTDERGLNVQVWHDYDYLPDALVFTATDRRTARNYAATQEQCDNGGTTTYYATGDLNAHGGTVVTTGATGSVTFSHC